MELQKKKVSCYGFLLVALYFASMMSVEVEAIDRYIYCPYGTKCYGRYIYCPDECPTKAPGNPKSKVCWVNCNSPVCLPQCKNPGANCDAPGAACLDPRFIGGDGRVFYFHGKSNEHYTLVTDNNLHINSRFIGHRPDGRNRDFTWIQAIGLLFGHESFSLEAAKAATWDPETDFLRISYQGEALAIPERILSVWESPSGSIRVLRSSDKNSATVTIRSLVEISVNVVPVTEEDDRIHKYRVPTDNCFAHLAVQFRFFALSPEVDGVLGRTYRPEFENPAKAGVAMPVVGGEDMYRTSSLGEADCEKCKVFSTNRRVGAQDDAVAMEYAGTLDCSSGGASGTGIVCKR